VLFPIIFQKAAIAILEALAHLISRGPVLGRELFQYTFGYR
jgi:hypothetical protein